MKKLIIAFVLFSLFIMSGCASLKSSPTPEQAKNKRLAEINIQLGMAYLTRGDVQRSKQKFLYAIQKGPELPETWYSLAYFYEQTGNKDRAQQFYLKAVNIAPNRGDVLNNYGTFLCRNGKYQESIQYFLTAIKDPQYLQTADAYENAGFCALKIPDHKQAQEYFNLALESDPTRITAMNELNKLSV